MSKGKYNYAIKKFINLLNFYSTCSSSHQSFFLSIELFTHPSPLLFLRNLHLLQAVMTLSFLIVYFEESNQTVDVVFESCLELLIDLWDCQLLFLNSGFFLI